MSPRTRKILAFGALGLVGLAIVGCCGCGLVALFAPQQLMLWALLDDRPLPVGRCGAGGLAPADRDALIADIRDDGRFTLTADQLCRLCDDDDLDALRIAIDDAGVHLDLSAKDEDSGRFLNVHTVGRVEVAGGHVTTARLDEVRVGRLDLGGLLAGRELGPDFDANLRRRAAAEPELARRLEAFRSVRIEGETVRIELDPARVDELLDAPGGGWP